MIKDLAGAVLHAEMLMLRRGLCWARGRYAKRLLTLQQHPAFLEADDVGCPLGPSDGYGLHHFEYNDEPTTGAGSSAWLQRGGGTTLIGAVILDVQTAAVRWRSKMKRSLGYG